MSTVRQSRPRTGDSGEALRHTPAPLPRPALLLAGALSGPVFVVGSGLGVAFRDGFDLTRLPVSALSLGAEGWTQIGVFLGAGFLAVLLAAGLRRVLRSGPGRAAIPLLVGAYGLGLLVAGAFVTDAGGGFPIGAPEGFPPELSWHATVHSVGAMTAMTAATIGLLVTARRLVAQRRRAGVITAVLGAVAAVTLLAWPDADSFGLRLALAAAVTCAWTTAVAVDATRRTTHGTPA